jgi:protein-S-isoprenylcysteine O-methyltransferase Ste14
MSTVNESKPPAKERWRPSGRQIIAAVIVVAALVFIFQFQFQNEPHTGHFHFLFFDSTAPVWFWMLVVFGAGLATGLVVAGHRAKQKSEA